MKRKVSYIAMGVAIGLAAATLIPYSSSLVSNGASAAAPDTYRELNLLGDVFDKISNSYVEKPNDSKVIEGAINGMLASLDPHSRYMDA
jgi:carboxyl-terminal processing protease